ncbi:hypothetical protein [Peromfec virus RodF7_17]|uniref:Uncharacterized protein n=1 Tax=Peromfec virus RodF7_17 TaxID=2929352 RepID=A0A976N2A1_9VIRU|nr:hypothetical protein [Peromfec virus RodF7_17]
MFRTQFTQEEFASEVLDDESMTVPDQAISVSEIKARAISGSLVGMPLVHPDEGDGDDDVDTDAYYSPDMDLTDLMSARQRINSRISYLRAKERERNERVIETPSEAPANNDA